MGLHTKDNLIISTKEKNTIVSKSTSEIDTTYILVRLNEFNKVAKSPIEEWVEYLKNGFISPEAKALGLQEAREKLRYYSMSDAERYAYDEHVNAIMIQNDVLENAMLEGHAEGLAEVRAEERIETAKRLLAMGLSPQQVADGTMLPLEEVEKLVDEIKNK